MNNQQEKVTVYTNGVSLFTLENHDKTSGVSHSNNITIHSEISLLKARSMHSTGRLYYVFGIGDRKELKNIKLTRRLKLKNFKIR